MQRILITGGSGLIGHMLTKQLEASGYEVAWLSRSAAKQPVKVFVWNTEKNEIDPEAIQWADAIVHLAGEGIADKRWTAKRKKQIIDSRVKTTALLRSALMERQHHVKTIVAASAIGWYGNRKHELLDENASAGTGFLSESVMQWEAATQQLELPGIRLVRMRIGIVLSMQGGALKELLMTAPFGILPVMGNGRQIYSWIHIRDVCGMMQFAIENQISGIYNAVAPNPVSEKEMMQKVREVKNRLYLLMPVPAFGLRMFLGEMSDAVLIDQHVSAKKILEAGYTFTYENITSALQDLFKK